jgi:hypothetical protein
MEIAKHKQDTNQTALPPLTRGCGEAVGSLGWSVSYVLKARA